MKTFLFIFLAGYAVRCDDNKYYVIQMPQDPKPFRVFWNVPTMQCKSKKIFFSNIFEDFGIIQNDGDSFRGEKVSILYDPGLFPALLKNETSGELRYRNGGVPQEGDLVKHLEIFSSEMEQSIPDKDFDGVGIIDFESWRPVYRQNFGVLTPYKDYSVEIEKRRHWWWKKSWITAEAKRRFEESGRAFMQTTLARAKQLRPRAKWGYYAFPYCFNMASNHMKESCADNVPEENDSIPWLWSESTALFPSVYSSEALTAAQLAALIRRRVAEAARLRKNEAPILPYFWYRYQNGGFLREEDLNKALSTLYKSEASGFIIWGSSKDVNTKEKCQKLHNYINNILGPAIAKYTKPQIIYNSEYFNDTNLTTVQSEANATDPDLVWVQPANYTENIKSMVDKEMEEELTNPKRNTNDSLLIDLILHSIANYCFDCYENVSRSVVQDVPTIADKEDNDTVVVLTTEGVKTIGDIVTEVVLTTEVSINRDVDREVNETKLVQTEHVSTVSDRDINESKVLLTTDGVNVIGHMDREVNDTKVLVTTEGVNTVGDVDREFNETREVITTEDISTIRDKEVENKVLLTTEDASVRGDLDREGNETTMGVTTEDPFKFYGTLDVEETGTTENYNDADPTTTSEVTTIEPSTSEETFKLKTTDEVLNVIEASSIINDISTTTVPEYTRTTEDIKDEEIKDIIDNNVVKLDKDGSAESKNSTEVIDSTSLIPIATQVNKI